MKRSNDHKMHCWSIRPLSLLTAFLCCFYTGMVSAQDEKKTPFSFSAYAEIFYSYDFNKPSDHERPPFLYHFDRHNEVNVNLAFLKAGYTTEKVRASLALAAGTYVNANYAAEPGVLKNLFEANAGVKLSKQHNLWLDAGIFSSHIGFESAVGKDNWTLSRNLCSESTPYYEAGVKLGYTSANEKWFFSALYLNGWQRITRPDGNSTPAFGTQITYKAGDKFSINSSTFIGNDKPDSAKQMRYFHNLYGIFQLSEKWSAAAGFDVGWEQQKKGSSAMNSWLNPTLIIKYLPTTKTALAIRAEYFNDKQGVIISTGTPNGFQTWGFSGNADVKITSNVLWRNELRVFTSKDAVFVKANNTVTGNAAFTTSLAVSFN